MQPRFVLFHAPRSRSGTIRWLLEEMGAAYEVVPQDLQKQTHKSEEFIRLNPDGKVPVLVDRGPRGDRQSVVTESVAIGLYLADAVPEAKLAPPLDAPDRGTYLTWMVYRAAAGEPAFADAVFPRANPVPPTAVGWPTYEGMLSRTEAQLARGPWLLGNTFTAADVIFGGVLVFYKKFGKLPPRPTLERYVEALNARPALQRAQAKDMEEFGKA